MAASTPLSSAEAALRRIVSDLHELSRRFALIGGLAVSARTEPRLTRDADLVVLVSDDADAEALIRALQERGWRVVAAMEQAATRRLASIRLAIGADVAGPVTDLLFASSGIEHEIVDAADVIDVVPGFEIAIAGVAHLIALKVLARDDRTRPQDRVDLAALLSRADAAVLREARTALETVARRGFHRGRDLMAALDAAVDELRA